MERKCIWFSSRKDLFSFNVYHFNIRYNCYTPNVSYSYLQLSFSIPSLTFYEACPSHLNLGSGLVWLDDVGAVAIFRPFRLSIRTPVCFPNSHLRHWISLKSVQVKFGSSRWFPWPLLGCSSKPSKPGSWNKAFWPTHFVWDCSEAFVGWEILRPMHRD